MPDLLPINATPQERAISLAVDRLPDVPIKTLWTPQTCPEAQLPWLAWALSVDEWDAAWPIETKRQAVADSIEQHRKKGTVGALRRALQRLGYEVEIDEQTGVAYTFRLRFKVREGESAGGAVAEDALNRAVVVALRQKNVRSSLLETLYIAETDPAGLFIGGVTMSGLSYEAKETTDYTMPPSDFVIEQTGASQVSASWSGTGEYYEVGWKLASDEDFSASVNAYTESITGISILAGEYIFRIRSFENARFSAWLLSAPFTVVIVPPSDITADTTTAGEIFILWTNLEFAVDVEICAAGNEWATIPYSPATLTSSFARYSSIPAGFYDIRVRSQGTAVTGTAYSEWVELTNIEVI